jgi:hypothetical protein
MNRAYLERVCATYLENWSQELHALSLPRIDLPLESQEVQALLGCLAGDTGTGRGQAPARLATLVARLDAAIACFPEGAFVRLGSRSGKDSRYALRHGLRTETGSAAVLLLTEGSRRVAFDLRLALRTRYRPHLFIRPWRHIPPWAEFRCFMRARQLIGISQYHWRSTASWPEIAHQADRIQAAIETFFPRFVAAVHLDDVVFDVFVESGSSGGLGVRLLELNPFLPETDACLFSWTRPPGFDGSFRFR